MALNENKLKTIKFLEESIDFDIKSNKTPETEKLYDLISQIEELKPESVEEQEAYLKHTKWLKSIALFCLRKTTFIDYENVYWRTVLSETEYHFESYILYLEKDRPYEKKFYEPRRDTLKTVVQDLQDLEDRKLRFLGVSLPARTGKSTLCIFFLSWIACKRPNSHSAMGGHSGRLAKGFYKELMNIFTTTEYRFKEIYEHLNPNRPMIVEKSVDDLKIVFDKPDRFATITCRGIDGTWTGDIDISKDGYLYVDDLIRDRTHSLSPTRMESTYQEYLNKMVDRKNDGARELMVGTLWNVSDPLERERKLNEEKEDYRFRKIPALDYETGESNFQYAVNGFSTKYYLDMKSRLDSAEWEAKYQQRPFVREGLLFPADSIKYFDGILPEGDYKIYAVVDVALGGGDYLSMPICMFNERTKIGYVVGWLYNNGTKEVTEPLIINRIRRYDISRLRFEKNAGGGLYKESVEQKVKEEKIMCLIDDVAAPNNMKKEEKIEYYSKEIKELYFISPTPISKEQDLLDRNNGVIRYKRDTDYTKAMDDLLMFVVKGKNVHDDSPDSLAQLVAFIFDGVRKQARIMSNPF